MEHIEYIEEDNGLLMICHRCGRIEGMYSTDKGEIERRKKEFERKHRECKPDKDTRRG